MHRTMLEVQNSFEDYDWFHRALSAVAKYLGRWDRLSRFRAITIDQNERFKSQQLKGSFKSLFKVACPSLQEQRWDYLYLGCTLPYMV